MKKRLIIGTLLAASLGCILLFGLGLVVQRWIYVRNITRPQMLFPLEMKWQADLGQSTYERPAYKDDLVFMLASQGSDNYWYSIDANSGSVIWSQQIDKYNFLRCLTSEYLVLSGPTSLMVLQTQSGEVVWKEAEPASADSATCNEKAVFSSGVPRDSIYAYSLANGQQLWGVTKPRKSFSELAYNPETNELIAKDTLLPGDMYIVEAESGLLKSSFKKVAYTPDDGNWRAMYVVDRGELFIGGTVQDAQTGAVIHQEEEYDTNLPPTVITDTMYLSAHFDGIVAFDRDDYTTKWVYQPQPSNPLNPLSPIAILNGVGYIIFSDATLRAFDLDTGQELGYWQPETNDLWAWPICAFPYLNVMCVDEARAGLATSEETLFVSFGDGKLYAFSK